MKAWRMGSAGKMLFVGSPSETFRKVQPSFGIELCPSPLLNKPALPRERKLE